ncbi:lysylphosphatidylglycerol synthase transmembrane domain-containing protein [Portibacter marinus]|uniref:lysylphosphatidylglycerol synthase transmembrane domain-containing protein n=1 Tax=Portibacter marinus TaxID=2898660 RepID=UPI001F1F1059|nr:lysylphosphatidylglycerol synthase transmembrane domain-containing protein [Portibacter marinus]
MGDKFKNLVKFFFFFAAGGIILYLLYRSQAQAFAEQCALDGVPEKECNYLSKIFSDFRSVKLGWVLLVVVMYMASNVSRAARWMMMFRPLGYSIKFINAVSTLMIGYFANLGLPRLGEVLRPVALSRYEKIGVEKVVGTIVAERALDVLMLLLFIGLALILEYDTLWSFIQENQVIMDKVMPILSSPYFYVLMIGSLVAAIYFLRSGWFRKSKFGVKIYNLVNGFLEGIKSIFNLRHPLAFIGHTIFIWIMYFMMTRVCFYAFEPTSALSLTAGLMVFVFGTLGIVFPSPGGMGSYHALLMAGLAIYGVGQADGFSFANIIFFTIQLFCNVFFGLLAYVLLPLVNKNYEGALSTES